MNKKWNWVDTLLVLLIAAVIIGGGYFLSGQKVFGAEKETKTITTMVELRQQKKAFTELPKVGDDVMMGEKEKMPAKVTKVEVLPATNVNYDLLEGTAKNREIPDYYDVRITTEATGTESAGAISVNGGDIRVGADMVLKSKNWAGHGFVLSIDTGK